MHITIIGKRNSRGVQGVRHLSKIEIGTIQILERGSLLSWPFDKTLLCNSLRKKEAYANPGYLSLHILHIAGY